MYNTDRIYPYHYDNNNEINLNHYSLYNMYAYRIKQISTN